MKQKAKKAKKRRIPLPWFCVFVVLFVFLFVAVMLLSQNLLIYNTVSSVLGDRQRKLVSGDPEKYVRYEGDYDSKAEVYDAANALNEHVMEEGIVLLKNEDDVLPLGSDQRNVTVFGKNSVDLSYGGSGSGGFSGVSYKTIYDSLEDAGFVTNPELKAFYEDESRSGAKREPNSDDLDSGGNQNDRDNGTFFHGIIYIYSLSK